MSDAEHPREGAAVLCCCAVEFPLLAFVSNSACSRFIQTNNNSAFDNTAGR